MPSQPLNALRVFEAAGRHRSFKQAAAELCVTQGAVTRHILKLEEHVGTRLFLRRHRQVELTAEGARYLLDVRDAFQHLYDATARVIAGAKANTLRLKVPSTFAFRWLVPRLARYQAQHRDISVQISTPFDAIHATPDFDVAVYYGNPVLPPGFVAERLLDEMLLPIVSPALANGPYPLRRPGDLARHVLLHSMLRRPDWRQWLAAADLTELDPESGLLFENSGLVYQAVAEGLGVAIGQLTFVAEDLAAGRLIAPFTPCVRNPTGYYLLYPGNGMQNANAREFRDWIFDEAKRSNDASRHFVGDVGGRPARPPPMSLRHARKVGSAHKVRSAQRKNPAQ